jgi:hypothetical protein
MRANRRRGASLILTGVALFAARPATAQGASEYQVKAAFLVNFARFAEWPTESAEPDEPLTICVFGADPFGAILDKAVGGATVNGRKVMARRSSEASGLRPCHVLFVSAAEAQRYWDASASLAGLSILSVGEANGFAARGGVINFVVENNRVRFEINLQAAARARLRLSSKLLQLATLVEDAPRK